MNTWMLSTIGDSSWCLNSSWLKICILVLNSTKCPATTNICLFWSFDLYLIIFDCNCSSKLHSHLVHLEFSQSAKMIFCTSLHNINSPITISWIISSLLLKEQTKMKVSYICHGSKFQFLILLSAPSATDIINWARWNIWNILSLKNSNII